MSVTQHLKAKDLWVTQQNNHIDNPETILDKIISDFWLMLVTLSCFLLDSEEFSLKKIII